MKKASNATAVRHANGDETGNGPQVGCIEITKVIRDFVPIISDEFGKSFGQVVDDTMKAAASADEEIQDLTLHISKEYWTEFKQAEAERIKNMRSPY